MTSRVQDEHDVIIVGGGFAGLSLAIALRQGLGAGASIVVVDRAEAAGKAGDPRAYALGAGSVRMLEALGVWQAVAAASQPVAAIDITDSPLETAVRPVLLSYDNHLDQGEPASWIVDSGALLAALADRAAGSDGVVIMAGCAVSGFTSGASGISVSLSDGRSLAGRLLVAADGRGSSIREAAGIRTIGQAYDQVGIVTRVALERPHEGRAVQHFLPAGPFAILPLPEQQACITWTEQAETGRRIAALDDAGFLAEVERRFGSRLGDLRLVGGRAVFPLEVYIARTFVGPRLALIGDCAHAVHPLAGQGLNLAFRDVAALAEVLGETARLGIDLGSGEALERYERWRRFDTFMSAAAFDGFNRLFGTDFPPVRALRDVGLGLVHRLPGVKKALVAEAAGVTGKLPRLMKGLPL
ncbi:MAG: FAD-dependent monooxygenase [Hyphomicrobiaceae bacterium]